MTGIQQSSTDAIIRQQMDRFAATVGQHVASGQPYALLDFPQHPNIGDSAIYVGEQAFLKRHTGRVASCVCTCTASMDWLEKRLPEGPILLHGGGNFGDIWPQHQNFRLQILERFKRRKVVQLAQSIHFEDVKQRDEIARRIEAHGNFSLLVRDYPSYDLATKHFDCHVEMCPDAAMMLWRVDPPVAPTHDILGMLRNDVEANQSESRVWLQENLPCEDWVGINVWTMSIRVGWKLARSFPESSLGMRYTEYMFFNQAWRRFMAGIRQLSSARFIVTDRLHVHIMSSLLRLPHLVLDNSYGKISRYIDAWGKDERTIVAKSLREMQEIIRLRGSI